MAKMNTSTTKRIKETVAGAAPKAWPIVTLAAGEIVRLKMRAIIRDSANPTTDYAALSCDCLVGDSGAGPEVHGAPVVANFGGFDPPYLFANDAALELRIAAGQDFIDVEIVAEVEPFG